MRPRTFNQLVDEYLAYIKEAKTKPTFVVYQGALRHLTRWLAANTKSTQIPKEDLLARFVSHLAKSRAPNTVSKVCAGIVSFYRWMMRLRYVRSDYTYDLRKGCGSKGNIKPTEHFTEQEFEKIQDWIAAHHMKYHWFNFLIVVAWNTGMRMSDICHLQWSQIDFDANTITFVPFKTRRMKPDPIVLPMLPEFRSFLWGWRMVHGGWRPVPEPCKPWDNAVCKTLCQMERFNKWSPLKNKRHKCWTECGISTTKKTHSFRHGFITKLVNRGVNPAVVASLTGQSLNIIMRYTNIPVQIKAQALTAAIGREQKPDAMNRIR